MAMADFPNVRKGARDQEGTNVRKVQLLLRHRDYSLDVDGIFGPQTEDRVRRFQRANSLVADGIVGPRTWPRLIVQVKRGSSGDAVRAVQSQFTFLVVDGIFGDRTDGAVRGFQNRSGIDVDGIVGPQTWRALTNSPIISA